MKSKTMILMVLAIGCGLVASILTSRMLAQQQGAGEPEKVAVLVAKQKLQAGILIKDPEKLFQEKLFAKGTEPKGAVSKFEDLKDHILNKPIGVEVHVTPEDLVDKNKGIGLNTVIRPGYRAVAMRVSNDTIVGGFVRPNSRVDVISTIRAGDQNSVARTILQNMPVLAVDMQYVNDEKAAQAASTVTLECKPEEAEKLTMAMALGELRLVLRNVEDDDPVRTKGARPADVLRGAASGDTKTGDEEPGKEPAGPVVSAPKIPDVPAAPPAAPAVEEKKPEPPKPPKTHTLTVINGGSVTRAVFVMDKPDGEKDTQINTSEPTAVAPPKVEKGKAPEPEGDPAKEEAPTPAKKGQDQ